MLASGLRRYAPVALAMISFAIPSGTSAYEWNCIVYVARPGSGFAGR